MSDNSELIEAANKLAFRLGDRSSVDAAIVARVAKGLAASEERNEQNVRMANFLDDHLQRVLDERDALAAKLVAITARIRTDETVEDSYNAIIDILEGAER